MTLGPGPRRRHLHRVHADGGQTSVELALALPLVFLVLLVVVQVGVVVHDAVLVGHAAREGARVAAVDPDGGAIRSAVLASASLDPSRTSVTVTGRGAPGSTVTVTVRYRSAIVVPGLRSFLADIDLTASTAMRVER